MVQADKVKLRHGLLNETRVSIISHLLSKPQNISELDKQLKNTNRSTICYHLNILEDVGILKSEYQILEAAHSKGKAARVFSINHDKLMEAVEAIQELRNELKA